MTLSKEQLRKAQLLLQKILDEVVRVCEENNIHYFLHYGTLIGAIRHNGFIPWDDDIDICMTRNDYDKFCSIAQEQLSDDFSLQNENTDEYYAGSYSKVILNNTKWIENNAKETKRKYIGLFIDIFPFDMIPENKRKQKIQLISYKIINMMILAKLNYSASTSLHYRIAKVFVVFFSLKYLKKQRNKIINMYSNINSSLVTNMAFYKFSLTKRSYIENLTKHLFEGKEYFIPVEYDKMLSDAYGNYMELPPPEKRINHSIVDFDFGPYDK